MIKSQRDNPDQRWMDSTKARLKSFIKWYDEMDTFQKRRTMPVTNAGSSTAAIGYRHPESRPAQRSVTK